MISCITGAATIGDIMERITNYHQIYSQIYDFPTMSFSDIASHTGLSRNTVARYVKEMYVKGILLGPHIRMKPAPNYTEYVYLMNFQDPYKVFRGLNRFPHVVYHAMTFGDWNTMIITDRLLDFSKLRGFQTMVSQERKGYSYTPQTACISWNESLKKMYNYIHTFAPVPEYKARTPAPLTWGEDDWTLFSTFKYCMRKKVTVTMKKINVRYETYAEWMNTLKDHCTIHTGFYPEGYHNYLSYCFLFHTDHPQSVQSLFSFLPTTPFIMELPHQLLVFTSTISSDITRNLFCTIYDMKTRCIIRKFNYAVTLYHGYH
jgi:DNA-binding Lrp family transcriptional regulator